jgi:two-component system sensor histidine kinase ChiS
MSGARWIVAGFAFAIASFVHDVLVSLWLISGASVSHIGLALCLFCVAFMAVRRYASSFDEVAALSARLGAVNRSLKRFAPEELLSYLRKDGIGSVQAGDRGRPRYGDHVRRYPFLRLDRRAHGARGGIRVS